VLILLAVPVILRIISWPTGRTVSALNVSDARHRPSAMRALLVPRQGLRPCSARELGATSGVMMRSDEADPVQATVDDRANYGRPGGAPIVAGGQIEPRIRVSAIPIPRPSSSIQDHG
jgi:hypothetical protein